MTQLCRIRNLAAGIAALIAVLAVGPAPALAQGSDSVVISDTALGAEGRIAVNAAAGMLNQQVNSAVIVESETALLANIVTQSLVGNSVCNVVEDECVSPPQTALIEGKSFSGAQGAIAVNIVAGVENQQANLAIFGIGRGIDGQIVALTALSQVRASQEPGVDPSAPAATKTAEIDSQTFTNASGLVQINSTAGERNSSANIFGLTLTGGTD